MSDNNLNPLEERVYRFHYDFDKEDKLTLDVLITKHRMTEENAKFNGIFGRYPLFIEIFRDQYEISVE